MGVGTISFPFNELGALIEYGAVPEYGHIADVENAVKLKVVFESDLETIIKL